MGKLFKIILSVIGLSIFYLWMSSVFQACGQKSDNKTEEVSYIDDIPAEEEIIDVSDEDFFEDEIDYLEEDLAEESYEESSDEFLDDTSDSYDQAPVRNNNPGNSYGTYMLISGNYLVESNAQEMVKKLNSLGFSNAEIVIFDRSQYHTVIASRFEAYDSALQSADVLRQKGVECYVKKRS
jgi:hypothetical protein